MPFENNVDNTKGHDKLPSCFFALKSKKNDHFETDKPTWDAILEHVDKSLTIWQPFYMNGNCADYVRSRGYKVIHEERDFFEWTPPDFDIIIDNPPYSIKSKVIERCKELAKPFVLLLPMRCVTTRFITRNPPIQIKYLYGKNHHFKKLDGKFSNGLDTNKGLRGNPLEPTWFVFNERILPSDICFEK